jgi:hypothetical protein
MFRLDRIQSWQPTEQHFNASPKERGWQAEDYNEQGDNSMTTVFNQVKFDYDQTTDNPYQKGSQLYNIRKQTDNIKQSKPIKIDQMQDNKPGPVTPNPNSQQIQQSQTQNDFQKMLKRNLEITQKEKEKRGFSLSNKNNPRGPVMTQNDENNEINNTENGSK